MTNVLLVEDSPFVMPALKECIDETPNLLLADCITNAANAKILCLRRKIDLIIMDVCTADNESGLKAAMEIKEFSPRTKVIIVTSMPEFSFIGKAKAAGCEGFWYKSEDIHSLKALIEKVIDGETVYPDDAPNVRIKDISSSTLTDRQ